MSLDGASETLVQNSLAALSNFATDSKIRDYLLEEADLLKIVSDLFQIYADAEKVQLDLIFLVRNCLRA